MTTLRASSTTVPEPIDVIGAWPSARPLCALLSAHPTHRRSRWSVLAEPEAWYRYDGRSSWIGHAPPIEFTHDPLRDLDALLTWGATRATGELPFDGGWLGYLSYDLGRLIEPTACAQPPADADRGWPMIELAWCPSAHVFDHEVGVWHGASPPAGDPAVERAIEYIAAGDIFQANITQRLSAPFAGSTRALTAAALEAGGPCYGALMEMPDGRAVVSVSPELFLEVDADRNVVTRPIKGTRPAHLDVETLRVSAKDAAELHMIVDLMRNDLGRVCEYGSIRVTSPREIETHPTVHQGVAEVTGILRDDVGVADLLRATFPPGSVTGAPKIRAMQIIDELEPVRRGPYCGAVGAFSRCGRVSLNVAIRTMCLSGARADGRWDVLDGVLDYGAGGGIVADSDAKAEWRESMDKVEVMQRVRDRLT